MTPWISQYWIHDIFRNLQLQYNHSHATALSYSTCSVTFTQSISLTNQHPVNTAVVILGSHTARCLVAIAITDRQRKLYWQHKSMFHTYNQWWIMAACASLVANRESYHWKLVSSLAQIWCLTFFRLTRYISLICSLLSIRISFICDGQQCRVRPVNCFQTNMYIARARCESQPAVGLNGLNARWL